MANNNIAFFLPTRKGSQRVINKNTRPFAHYNGGLLENKLIQLLQTKRIDEIILSTNDEQCIEIAQNIANGSARVKIIERPQHLCLDTTNLVDLINYVPTITNANHILWGHVTTPLAGAIEYDKAIDVYLSETARGFDSLISVTELKNFLLNKNGQLINNTTSIPWPRTQDLETLFEINHVMFIASRNVYLEQKNRIGKKPYLHVMDKIASFDVDWEDDFLIAESIFKNLNPTR
jgi:CMP-N-acetylneuraminic acid synthetase